MAPDDGDHGASSGAEDPDEHQPDGPQGRQPLPPEDRLWRHPSEMSSVGPPSAALPPVGHRSRLARWPTVAAVGAAGALIAGAALATGQLGSGSGPARATAARAGTEADSAVPVISRDTDSTPSSVAVGTSLSSLVGKVNPSVLAIRAHTTGGDRSGSGLVYRSDGIILTTDRLVEGSSSITAVTPDGQEEAASLIGADSDTDVAVLRVAGRDLPTAPFAPDATTHPGDLTLAITRDEHAGSAPVVYLGTVRAVDQQVAMPTGPPLLDMIYTDTPISGDIAGGALLDTDGWVVGITAAVSGGSSGTRCLATPVDLARRAADELINTGHVTHGWLGIQGRSAGAASAGASSVTSSAQPSTPSGVRVLTITPSSPAAAAGLEPGDTITTVDHHPVSSMLDLQGDLHLLSPGAAVSFGVWRNGRPLTMGATLAADPS